MRRYSDEGYDSDLIKWLDDRYTKRQHKERRLQEVVGNREKQDKLYKLDIMLEYSGIRGRFSFINAEVFLGFVFLCALAVHLVLWFFFGSFMLSILAMGLVFLIFFALVYAMSGIYYVNLEKNIMTFLNLIENFSKTDDDIVQIFRKAVMYLDEPLRSLLKDFCSEAESLGDTNRAFESLTVKVEHRKCKELLRNLAVCSRYETNYEDIVKDCRASMIDYLSIKAERKAIISNGRAEVLILLAGAGVIISLFAAVTTDMYTLLLESFIGNLIILYCGAILLVCMIMMLLFDKKGG